jgi:hypothetical protein
MPAYTKDSARVRAVRAALRYKYGARQYKIAGHIGVNEQISIYSKMPNSNETGWWLMGDIIDAEIRLGVGE